MGTAMTTIRTTCPTCGEVDMGAAAISLRLSGDGGTAAYAFTCPECREQVSKNATRKTVALLVAAGVEVDRLQSAPGLDEAASWELPIPDRSPAPDAPALTIDDLIAFHFVLEDEAAIERLLCQDR
jgi:predicted RNA-binding Zn-ribbon protein involved in translation (DUF1610 family)